MPQEKFFNRPFVVPSLFLAAALLAGLIFVGRGIAARTPGDIISVTGSASQTVESDEAQWTVDVSRTVQENGIPAADAQIAQDASAVEQFFKAQNLASSTVTLSTIYSDINYAPEKEGESESVSYDVHETVTVETSDVHMIDALSRDLANLDAVVSNGTIVSPQPPQYYVSTLPQLRVSLLGEAVKDARNRAQSIAKSGGTEVGALESASSGVVQVLAPNSTDVEGDGAYDTSTIEKEVEVTAHVDFYVN